MAKTYLIKTLNEFILEKQADFAFAKGDLSSLLHDVGLAAKIVNWDVNKAGLGDILGEAGNINVQGESQKKLDIFADEIFIAAFKAGGQICALASEENECFLPLTDERAKNAKYVIAFDPLDGSSNIDVNVSIGTIFSIYRRISIENGGTLEDFMQKGVEQVAAGYVLYGSSTMLVYTTGHGTNGFTLDPSIGEFCLSHPDIKIPEDGFVYSLNEGNHIQFDEGVKKYVKYCQEYDSVTNRPYSGRYIGSLVADFHRNLLRGGIYIYPATTDSPEGKLRLLYECNPLAFVVEQAGGKASTGFERILDIQPTDIHQRVPFFCGSQKMVEKAEEFMAKFSPKELKKVDEIKKKVIY